MSLFYDGCIIAEIRDFRRLSGDINSSASPEIRHVLLQASTQTLVADLNSICNSGHYIWTQEDKYSLESQLLVATQPALCLDPSPRVAVARSHALAQSSRAFTADRRLKRFALRYTEAYRRRALARWHDYSLPYPFRIAKLRRNMQSQHQQAAANAATVCCTTPTTPTPTSSLLNSNTSTHLHAPPHSAMARISSLLANAFSSNQVIWERKF